MRDFTKENLTGKRVLLRLDINVPIKDNIVTDNTRLIAVLPTLNKLLEMEAKVIIISHLGRPKGKVEKTLSLLPVYKELINQLEEANVYFASDILDCKNIIENLQNGEAVLLENIRFYKEEEQGSDTFAKQLASLADFYINDAFSCSHRAHTSISYINKYLPSAPGLLLLKEVKELTRIFQSPKKPFTSIIGGGKISSKIDILNSLIKISDNILIGGAMANTFLKAQGHVVGGSLVEDDHLQTANKILKLAEQNSCNIFLPIDATVAAKDKSNLRVISIDNNIKDNEAIYDIGPKTIDAFIKCLEQSASAIWNGPLGMIEEEEFRSGSVKIAEAIAKLTKKKKLYSIAGGGDVVAAINMAGVFDEFSYISTAGGAFLEWIEGKKLPGVAALE